MKRFLLFTGFLFSFFTGFGQCPPSEDVIFSSQAEVNAFAIDFPDCTGFSGTLTISGNDITDLSPLLQLVSIGDLIIDNNSQLTSLIGFGNLENYTGNNIIISNNPSLLSLDGIDGLGGESDVESVIEIVNNDSLINLEGLNELINTDFLVIEGNDALLNLTGLDNYLGSAVMTISNNASLESFEGMNNFNGTTSLTIEDNPSLIDISSLSSNQFIEGFFIINNDSLTNIDGLEVTNEFFGFRIVGNDALVNISALSNIQTPSSLIEIIENSNLSVCSIDTLCTNTTTDTITITNNASGCNSIEEIEETCSSCPTGPIILASQAEVNAFAIDFPNCTEVSNELIISGDDITNLSPLSQIVTVDASLNIVNNPTLESLQGLENISRVMGMEIESNDLLPNLLGLEGLIEGLIAPEFGNISIRNNASLTSLQGLNNFPGGSQFDFEIINNDNLLNFEGLDSLFEIEDIIIVGNELISDFTGLVSLERCDELIISDNINLTSLNGLNLIEMINGLVIENNPLLANLDGINSLTTLSNTLIINNNNALTNLNGLMSVGIEEDPFVNELTITNNPNLAACDIEVVCEFLNFDSSVATVDNNASGCNSVEEVQEACSSCPTGPIILASQAEVNEYAVQFPDCDIIQGILRISGNDIVDLSPLNTITTVGDLEIIDNPSLENLDGLALMSIGKTTPDSEPVFTISGNPSLENLDGLSQLFEIEAKTFDISNNPLLTNLDVFNNVSIEIDFVDAILKIDNNISLVTMNGFDEIFSFSGDLTISNNPLLESLPSNLAIEVSDVVSIINNDSLLNLEGLENLSSITVLDIENNSQLLDITAISNALSNDSNIELIITDNPLLEICSFEAMCAFLDANVIEAMIENNGIGCTSVEEVEENCLANFNIISGNILFDFNNDGCTTDDYAAENILVQTTNGVETHISITDEEGNFSFFVDEGVYTTSIISESLPVEFQGVPESVESTFTGLGNEEMIDFCVEAIEVVNDIAITVIPLQEPRPGFDALYVISYSNVGTTVESGTITMNFDEEILFYENSSLPPFVIDATFIEWEYDELLPFETRSFEVGFEVFTPPTVQDGNILVSEVEITTSIEDINPDNNVFVLDEVVVNSFDPNDKQVLQGERIIEEEVGDYLDYVIRFQNTGTADAINVIVTDVLSDNLNWNTLRILSSSDDYRVEITNGNEVSFIFENINLPPEEEDEEGSNGHIAFQIRSNDDLILGDAIENTANIFFDFNAPIITNTVTTTVSEPCPVGDIILTSQAEVDAFGINYPNCAMISFPSNVTISGADIVDLTPLSQITSIENDFVIDNNPQLVSLAGLENLTDFAGGNLIISNNPTLSSLNGLGAIGFSWVQIINNDALTNLSGLEGLVESFLIRIEDNDALQDLSGLDNYSIGVGNIIRNNASLSSLNGLESLMGVETIIIEDNPLLTDISSLENVQEIVVLFEIRNNDSLTNLAGLQNAGTFFNLAAGFRISDNDALVDISALSNFETPTQFIEITNNSSLSNCVISLLCDNITNTDLITISDNAPGCNTTEEVEEACDLGVDGEILENAITIYPNPTVDILNVVFTSDIQLQSIEVFSVTGKKIQTTQKTSIDFSSLTRGVYFARIQTNQGVLIKKIVKK